MSDTGAPLKESPGVAVESSYGDRRLTAVDRYMSGRGRTKPKGTEQNSTEREENRMERNGTERSGMERNRKRRNEREGTGRDDMR